MEYIKKVFRNYWVLSVFCVVLGIALIINPQFFTNAIGYVVGGLFAGYGVIELIKYFAKANENPEYSTCLVRGIILCAIGVFIIIRPDFIPKVIAVTCGIYMIISGAVNIQDSINLKRAGIYNWKNYCIPAVITTILGIILVFNPLAPVEAAMIILGIALLASGILNIAGCFGLNGKIKRLNKVMKTSSHNHNNDKDDFIDI